MAGENEGDLVTWADATDERVERRHEVSPLLGTRQARHLKAQRVIEQLFVAIGIADRFAKLGQLFIRADADDESALCLRQVDRESAH